LENPLSQSFATISEVQFIDGGRKLLFRILEGTVKVYDFETNLKEQFTRRKEDVITTCLRGEVACSADGRTLVVSDVDGVLRLWNLRV
jgi:WD40 repeat protein